jgi:hypothetical protein
VPADRMKAAGIEIFVAGRKLDREDFICTVKDYEKFAREYQIKLIESLVVPIELLREPFDI